MGEEGWGMERAKEEEERAVFADNAQGHGTTKHKENKGVFVGVSFQSKHRVK